MPDAFDAERLAELEAALERTRLDSPFHVCAIALIAEVRRLQARLAAERTRLYRRGDAITARGWEYRVERDRLIEACVREVLYTDPADPAPGTPYTEHRHWTCVLTPNRTYATKAEAIAALREAASLDPTPPERRPPDPEPGGASPAMET